MRHAARDENEATTAAARNGIESGSARGAAAANG